MRENESDVGERELGYRLRNRKVVLIHAFILVAVGAAFATSEPAVKRIEIKSEWQGLAPTQRTRVVIRSSKGIYRAGRVQIDAALVDAFVSALREPSLQKPDLVNLGVTPTWLQENADAARKMVVFENTPQYQKVLFPTSFTDSGFVAKVFPSIFDYAVLDDWPRVRVRVILADGSMLSAWTNSSYAMMLPWKMLSAGQESNTYNANISRALAAVMPKDSTNRERLAGNDLVHWLAQAVIQKIEETDRKRHTMPK